MTVFNHIPYEFFQPWLSVLLGGDQAATPAAAGLVAGGMMALSAWTSRRSARLGARFGTRRVLLSSMLLQGVTITAMAIAVHPMLAPFLLLRSVPQAIMGPLLHGAVLRRVPSRLSATFLSTQSLAGRLAFSASMVVASTALGHSEGVDPAGMARILAGFALLTGAGLVVFGAWRAPLE